MKKLSSILLASAAALTLLFASCKSEKKKALEFNNKLAGYNQALNDMGRKWSVGFGTARVTKEFAPVQQTADSIVKVVDGMITNVNGMQDVGGSEALRKKELDYLRFEREFIQSSMTPFHGMDSSTTDEEVDMAIGKMLQNIEQENQHLAELTKLQADFAKRNGFTVKPAPTTSM